MFVCVGACPYLDAPVCACQFLSVFILFRACLCPSASVDVRRCLTITGTLEQPPGGNRPSDSIWHEEEERREKEEKRRKEKEEEHRIEKKEDRRKSKEERRKSKEEGSKKEEARSDKR